MYIEGSPISYLKEYENWFDLSGFIIILIYCIISIGKDENSTNHHTSFLCIGMLITNVRMMIHLSIFNESLR